MNYKNLLLILFFVFCFKGTNAQPGQWLWIKSTNHFGGAIYGTQGVPGPTNNPPGLYESCEWTDLNGNFWIYGGNISGSVTNDLWKYNPVTNEWTWMNGNATWNDPGVYGVMGIPSPLNRPPAYGWGELTWTDSTGDLWLYGGLNSNILSGNLWRYNISTNMWTWMKGPGQTICYGIHGIRTVPDTANYPSGLFECSATWRDNTNNLWLFGGAANSTYSLNELWRYDIATNTWTWMKGDSTTAFNGVQSAIGLEDSSNNPSGRYPYAHWKDAMGNFWLFGGMSSSCLNDLWKFNPLTNNWTYMGGKTPLTNYTANFGNYCIPASTNWPLERQESRSVWTDMNGDFWMYGGLINSTQFIYHDLWKYCVSTNQWIAIDGDTVSNVPPYGLLNVPDPLNDPGRRYGAVSFRRGDDLYLFGGWDYIREFSDLWKFTIDSTCAPCQSNLLPAAQFVFDDSTFCAGVCVNFTNQSANAFSYEWIFPGATPSSSTDPNPQNICYATQGNYDVTLIATNTNGTDTFSIHNAITVTLPAAFSPIVQHGDTLFADPNYQSYQWFYNGTLIPGSTNNYHVAMQNGNYSVQVTDSNGCSAVALILNIVTAINENSTGNRIIISSANGVVLFESNKLQPANADFYITNAIGQIVYRNDLKLNSGMNVIEIPESILNNQEYFLVLRQGENIMVKEIGLDIFMHR